MVLWQVERACVADFKLTGTPFPCLEVDRSGGEERGNVVLRPPLLDDTILAPMRKITGIEDPFLQSPLGAELFRRRMARARSSRVRTDKRQSATRSHLSSILPLSGAKTSSTSTWAASFRTPAARSQPLRRKSRWAKGRRSGRSSLIQGFGHIASRERFLRASIRFGSPPRLLLTRRGARAN
jgi:hypothetical protein